jgi:hypothetical protein
MFRKIHSNRDPKDTILSQIKTEFRPYIEQASKSITQKLATQPIAVFIIMVLNIIISAGVSFTIFRNPAPAVKKNRPTHAKMNVVTDGFDQISHTASTIQQTIRLKNQIDSLSNKYQLNRQDSLTLEKDLDQLRHLQKQQTP